MENSKSWLIGRKKTVALVVLASLAVLVLSGVFRIPSAREVCDREAEDIRLGVMLLAMEQGDSPEKALDMIPVVECQATNMQLNNRLMGKSSWIVQGFMVSPDMPSARVPYCFIVRYKWGKKADSVPCPDENNLGN